MKKTHLIPITLFLLNAQAWSLPLHTALEDMDWSSDPHKQQFVEKELMPALQDYLRTTFDALPEVTRELSQLVRNPKKQKQTPRFNRFEAQTQQKLKRIIQKCQKAKRILGKPMADQLCGELLE